VRRVLQRLACDETGVALVIALMLMLILAGTTAALVVPGAVNQRNSLKGSDAKQAFALAETAVAYGEGAVYSAGQNGHTPPSGSQPLPAQPGGGTGSWSASVGADGYTWTITATGTVDGITRKITVVAADPSATTVVDTGAWNYLYSDQAGTTCATSMNGTVSITVPLLVRGDLCIGGSLNYTGSQLEVGGNLSVTGSAKIGSSTTPISTLRVGLTSTSTSTCNTVTPGTGACDGHHSPIYASSVSEGVDVVPQMPCIGQPSSWDSLCTGSSDGTWTTLKSIYNAQAALTKTGCPTNLLDSDSTLNNGDSSISNVMFGNTDYDCKVGTANEIKWAHATNTLTVKGTLYFDGSLNLKGTVIYSGQASMYFTGGIGTTGGPVFCGASSVVGGNQCTSSWNPDVDGIIFVAGCWADTTGVTLTTTGCISLGGGSNVQFGAYCTTNYATAGGSSNMGPVLANSLNLGGSTSSLIPFHYMPPGTPLNYRTVIIPAKPPQSWSG